MDLTQLPWINRLQRFTLYETRQRFYLAASDPQESKFRLLKIDRSERKDCLSIFEDKHIYTAPEFNDLLHRINLASRIRGYVPPSSNSTSQQTSAAGVETGTSLNNGGLSRGLSAFGVAGFVRFLEGYYMILITKRRKVAQLGQHIIYKVEDTTLVYIPSEQDMSVFSPSASTVKHPDEARYVKIFQSVDLSSNFYFSYTYDLTHILQYNMELIKQTPSSKCDSQIVFCVRNVPYDRFVWNWNLIEPFVRKSVSSKGNEKNDTDITENAVDSEWILPLIHGFVGQTYLSAFGQPVFITLIGRRSRFFAGARFLKRGCNIQGDVANEVETEQIVHEGMSTPLHRCRVSAFVQHRGSVPLFWAQDITKVVGKPPIDITREDPYYHAFGLHFDSLLERYGTPILVLNLVKQRERRPAESQLTTRYREGIEFLNQFLPQKHRIVYVPFDMARVQKSRNQSVLKKLAPIAQDSLRRTGIFVWHPNSRVVHLDDSIKPSQFGVVRTNCVDCLDRTNAGQFVIGQAALGRQLFAIGCLSTPTIRSNCKIDRLLQELYEAHGDTLALQYGGSQLVHNIETYRKTAKLSSHSRDIMQTISRYYSNTFSDTDKQIAINVFLGIFRPFRGTPAIWENSTDSQLHWNLSWEMQPTRRRPYTDWCPKDVISSFPRSYDLDMKAQNVETSLVRVSEACVDWFSEIYPPDQLLHLDDLLPMFLTAVNINGPDIQTPSSGDMRRRSSNGSIPFPLTLTPPAIRKCEPSRRVSSWSVISRTNSVTSLVKKSKATGAKGSELNVPTSDSDSELGTTDEEERVSLLSGSGLDGDCVSVMSSSMRLNAVNTSPLIPEASQIVYASELIKPIHYVDKVKYTRYVDMNWPRNVANQLLPISALPMDSSLSVTPPVVSRSAREVYKESVRVGACGIASIKASSMQAYRDYISIKDLFRV